MPKINIKNKLITGTLILTCAAFLSRILGFFYRIYLSNVIGPEGIGLYQIVMPIYGLCFAITVAGISTIISKNVAENKGNTFKVLINGITISLTITALIIVSLHILANPIATFILGNSDCSSLLRLLTLSLPFGVVHVCINAYYLGLKKTVIPGLSQLIEQIIKIIAVILIIKFFLASGMEIGAKIAIYGIIISEIASSVFCVFLCLKDNRKYMNGKISELHPEFHTAKKLAITAFPLSVNKIMLSFLGTAEALLIPFMLQKSGLSPEESLGVFGILTGMAFPFIMFPTTIVTSLANILLPDTAEANTSDNKSKISRNISLSLNFSLILGILCTGIFLMYGLLIGNTVFGEPLAGNYIIILSWLCPFIYLSTTFASILNGLGKIKTVFIHNVISVCIRISFVIFLIPEMGISAYFCGLLSSEIMLSLLHLYQLDKYCKESEGLCHISFNSYEAILFPALTVTVCGSLSRHLSKYLMEFLDGKFDMSVKNCDILTLLLSISMTIGFFVIVYLIKGKFKEIFKNKCS
ncbi:MAG: polysaccharide biosynthesis protein [Lachnospiraceae bacterium]|nr:polysaccharide biosynthesis protein [Lachnospiraceae bacterium]